MKSFCSRVVIGATLLVCGVHVAAYGDFQEIAPGTGLQGAVEIDTGANGVCETAAGPGEIQATPLGTAPAFQPEIKCGANKVVDTTAAGDDTQLLAVGAACASASTVVIDTGPNGIADTAAVSDDTQSVPTGTAPPNLPCVLTGATGVANTSALGGDDVRDLPLGTAQANAVVIRCGANKVAETTANNVGPGDDVQVVPVGTMCASKNTIVVNAGPNGLSTTRAEGADLVVKAIYPSPLSIAKGKTTVSKTVRVTVSNVEFGAAAPASRSYTLSVTDGTCPAGTVSNVDADASPRNPGLQTSASVPKGGRLTASFVATFHVEDVTSVDRSIPFRCSVSVEADAVDTAPAPDDAIDTDNNATSVDFEVVDRNDLP